MMNGMIRASSHFQRLPRLARSVCAVVCVALPATLSGCQEFVYMGQLSDRESSQSINNAKCEQRQSDGEWKVLGTTDGKGRWWILKENIQGGGQIRITKPGYYPRSMSESEFLSDPNLLMIPSSSKDSFGGSSNTMWQRYEPLLELQSSH